MKKNSLVLTKTQVWQLLLSFAVYIVLRLIPMPGLSLEGQKALAILGWIIVVLITKCLPTMLTNIIFAAGIILTGVIGQGPLFSAFGTSPFILVMGLSVVALGMSKTNLGARIAYTMIRYVGKTPSLLVLAICLTGTILSTLIVNLPALLAVCPIILSVLKELNEVPGQSNLGKAMFLGLIWTGGIGGLVLISSNGNNAAGVDAFAAATEGAATISYAQWAIFGIPMAIVMVIPSWLLLSAWFKVNKTSHSLDPQVAKKRLAELGPMNQEEIRYIIILIVMILAFFFGGNFGITAPTVALLAMILMLAPYVGLVDFEEAQKNINWSMLFQVGFFVGFAGAITSTGLGEWLTSFFSAWTTGGSLLTLIIVVNILGHVAAFLVPGGGAAIMLVPSVVAMANNAGVSAALLTLVLLRVCSCSLYNPVQAPFLVVGSCNGGYLDVKDYVIPNIIGTTIWTIVCIPLFYFLAPLAGMG